METKPIYLLVGDEEFLKEEWLRNTRQKFFKSGNTSDNTTDYDLFFANEIDLPGVLSIAKTRPFLNSKRLVVIKNLELLNSPSHKEQLLNYAIAPSSGAVLILEAGIKEKDFLKNKFLIELGKLTQIVAFKKLYDGNLHDWISRRAAARKKRIEPRAIELLKQLKGNNLKAIDEEIEKLSLYIDAKTSITQSDVQQLAGKDITSTIYDMIDAISNNDKEKAMALTVDFQKKDLSDSINLFCWNLRLLLRVKECPTLDLQKFQLKKALDQARRLDTKWLKSALSELTAFDLKVKTSGIYDSFSGWQMLVAKLLKALL